MAASKSPSYSKPQTKLPPWMPVYGWEVTKPTTSSTAGKRGMGYLRNKSKAKGNPVPYNTYAHRYVMLKLIYTELTTLYGDYSPLACHRRSILEELLLDGKLHPDLHVHHQDFDKTHCCGPNLIAIHPSMNPAGPCRNPYTGARISQSEYAKITK